MRKLSSRGFTLLEILLVVAAIAILAGIVIVAINPGKQLGDTRNAQRSSDVNAILNAVSTYQVSTGNLPASIAESATCSAAANEICKTGGTCTNLIDLSVLTSGNYIVSLPTDPTGSSTNGTGYHIVKNSSNRVTVCAPDAENNSTISITR